MLAVAKGEGPPPTTTTPTCAPCKNILDGPYIGEYMLAPGLQVVCSFISSMNSSLV